VISASCAVRPSTSAVIAPASPAIIRSAGRASASQSAVTAATEKAHHQCAISSPARIQDATSNAAAFGSRPIRASRRSRLEMFSPFGTPDKVTERQGYIRSDPRLTHV